MSDKDKNPWYKNPVYLVIIGGVLAAIIGVTWAFWLNPPPPDFSIYVSPLQGTAPQGGTVTTTITVKGEHGYKQSVSLSASGQPPNVVVNVVPPIGGATPAFTSNVIVNVGSDVPVGRYEITITGLGVYGKSQNVKYILKVMPPSEVTSTPIPGIPAPTPTPTPTPTSSPTPPPDKTIFISNLQEDDEVSYHYPVKGSGNVMPDSELKIYVLIKPLDSPLPWYVQPPATIQSNGDWEADAYFGRNIEDRGHYKVCAIITAEELYTHQTFEKIPKNAGVSKIITVKHTYTH